MKLLALPEGFQWDGGNFDKSLFDHEVLNQEAEGVFFDRKKFIFKDKLHSEGEERYRIIGKTNRNRLLFVVFTLRDNRVRIISARDMNKKEVYLYEKRT